MTRTLPAPRSPGRLRRAAALAWRWTRRLLVLGLAAGLVGAAALAWAYQRYVVDEPGEHISRSAIEAIIAQESPVLYADGQARIGVFFAQEHRAYVPYERIPRAWVDAIVAAEDQRYFEHRGVDPRGIARAMRDNLLAGGVVAGGSTLTQQTAKNLYYRPDRSLRSKWEELLNALRLEQHYTKEEILEFYANQFHVSANGRGLGIAARYFFDKEPHELGTLECAFLAGMVKAPASYNPFLGRGEERRAAAAAKAQARTRYVLDRMLVTGALGAAEHAALIQQEIPFKKGTFRYDTHVILDEVADRLERAPFPALFAELGIDNPSTAGIQVVTTIDQQAQEGATYALWHHLTEVGPLLEGAAPDWQGAAAFRLPADQAPALDPHDPPHRWQFRLGTVAAVGTAADPHLALDLAGHPCRVDAEGVRRVAGVVARARKGETWRQPAVADVEQVLAALPPGAVVRASVRQVGPDGATCDLELRPELQGAALLLEEGRIRAMVGGNDNRNFNRAVAAKRQLGSTWKPALYFAALQLGWLPTDALDNRPGQVFRFEGTWYYPRPDHASEPFVSLGWAGTRSENLASIWLLAHLLDRLDPDRFAEVAAAVDLVPRRGEERTAWIERIRDEYGVISTEERVPEVAFHAVRRELVEALRAEGREAEARELDNMLYGSGAEAERARQAGQPERLRWLRLDFLRMEELAAECEAQAERLHRALDGGALPAAADVSLLRVRPGAGRLELGCGDQGEGWAAVGDHLLAAIAAGVPVPVGGAGHMWVEGRVQAVVLERLRRDLTRRALVLRQADPWSVEVLQHHPDYRQLVGMRYLALVARSFGVSSDLPPVLSMPLGAVDISLEEAATLYQGMLRGETWSFPGQRSLPGAAEGLRRAEPVASPDAATLLIAEIRDRHGNVLYRATPAATAQTEAAAGRAAGDILRNVVRWGTGRRAEGAVTLAGQPVPLAGKTGTTNGYRNAAFVGFVPRAVPGSDGPRWRWGEGYTLAVYVGYDDNRTMRRGGVRLQGASGALPAWIGTAAALAEAGLLGKAAPAVSEWEVEEGYRAVPVAEGSGLPLEESAEAAAEAGRTVLVPLERGVWGLTDDPWRIVAPVPGAREAGPPPTPGGPLVEGDGEAEEQAPGGGEAVGVEAVGGEASEAGAGEAEEQATGAGEAGAGEAGAGEAGAGGAGEEDAVRAWLGELLDEPVEGAAGQGGAGEPVVPRIAPGAPLPGDPGPTAPGAGEPGEEPGEEPGGDSGVVPRIAPGGGGAGGPPPG